MWNWYGAALAKNTSQNPDSVLRLHVIAKIKVHFAHYRLLMKEGWEISCVVPSNYFEAIVPSQCASHCNADIFTFELARSCTDWARISPLCPSGINGKKQDLHLSSTRHLHRSPSQDRCGSGNIWPWASLHLLHKDGRSDLCFPRDPWQSARLCKAQLHTECFQKHTNPITEPIQLHSPFSLFPCRANPDLIYRR